jgi:hypothetical protein
LPVALLLDQLLKAKKKLLLLWLLFRVIHLYSGATKLTQLVFLIQRLLQQLTHKATKATRKNIYLFKTESRIFLGILWRFGHINLTKMAYPSLFRLSIWVFRV